MAVAEKFGQLPDTVENEMSVYWLDRVAVYMEAQAINDARRRRDDARRNRTKPGR